MVAHGQATRRDWRDPNKLSINEKFALQYLKRFDAVYGPNLRDEAKRFQEAEASTDLYLPYSVSRAIAAEAAEALKKRRLNSAFIKARGKQETLGS